MTRLPTLFVSHGSPMEALDAGASGQAWRQIAASLPKPRAIVVLSAHWSSTVPQVGSGVRHETIHDFYGFPRPLYEIQYPVPGAPQLALRLASALRKAGWPAELDQERGLDHGAWVPLRYMYPDADVPVVPVSIDARQSPEYHYRFGAALGEALDDDVLLVASGSLTHNLHDLRGVDVNTAYVGEFQDWVAQQLAAGDLDALLDYRRRAPHSVRAHPTDEHLLPLYVALGAAGEGAPVTRYFDQVAHQVLAMDAYGFGR